MSKPRFESYNVNGGQDKVWSSSLSLQRYKKAALERHVRGIVNILSRA